MIGEIPFQIIKKYGISLLILFGSYTDGSNKQDSDLDLAFLSKESLDLDKELALLEELTGYYRKYDLDLVNLRKASPVLKLEVANKGKLLYGTAEDFLNFQLYAASSYADSKYLRLEREKYLKKRLSEL